MPASLAPRQQRAPAKPVAEPARVKAQDQASAGPPRKTTAKKPKPSAEARNEHKKQPKRQPKKRGKGKQRQAPPPSSGLPKRPWSKASLLKTSAYGGR
ncbi:MAG: hypothetical protein ACREBW_10640 [Candidatus Micrarchaeaceae archaeon]